MKKKFFRLFKTLLFAVFVLLSFVFFVYGYILRKDNSAQKSINHYLIKSLEVAKSESNNQYDSLNREIEKLNAEIDSLEALK